ncbi:TPA: SMI1/KNR4 family protein [Stenotrophomonas maltophilia]|nr:SMI1/KNR4 family protein [Stenotrophomonas maltophilia]
MDDLHAAFARFGLLRAQYEGDWQGPFPLPPVLACFYAQVGPLGHEINAKVGNSGITIPGLDVWIPPLRRVWSHQAGYRWHGIGGDPIDNWPSNWLVIADRGADPFILDLDDGRVLFSHHGAGLLDAGEVTTDVPTLMAALAAAGTVYLDAGDDLYNDEDDGGIRPEHQEAAVQAVARVLGDHLQAESFIETLLN